MEAHPHPLSRGVPGGPRRTNSARRTGSTGSTARTGRTNVHAGLVLLSDVEGRAVAVVSVTRAA